MSTQWQQLFRESQEEIVDLKKARTRYRKLLREVRNWMIEHGFSESLQEKIKETLQKDGRKK